MMLTESPLSTPMTAERYQPLADLIVGRVPMQAPSSAAEWAELAALAEAEGVAPLLARALRDQSHLAVPAATGETLGAAYRNALYFSLLYQSMRERLCQRLSEQSIPVILLKGADLAVSCYDDPATRPMSDLDVLVPRARREEAGRCLEQEGFQPRSGSLVEELRSHRGHMGYVHLKTRCVVEVHWTLKGLGWAHAAAVAEIWAGALPATFDPWAQVMRPGHKLPLLAAHMLLQHRLARLLWLYDLHRVLLATDAAEAAVAREAATRWRIDACLAVALLSVRELFGTLLPEPLSDWASATVVRQHWQARRAALPLTSASLAQPDGRLMNLIMNRDWSQLRSLFPSPATLRRQLSLSAQDSVLPAYASLLLRYLRRAPANCLRFWRYWLATPPPRSEDRSRRP
jgi:hypothetical protein